MYVRTYLFRSEVLQCHGGSSVHVLVLVLGGAVDHLIDINDDDSENDAEIENDVNWKN
jgi:hypothetical protein